MNTIVLDQKTEVILTVSLSIPKQLYYKATYDKTQSFKEALMSVLPKHIELKNFGFNDQSILNIQLSTARELSFDGKSIISNSLAKVVDSF